MMKSVNFLSNLLNCFKLSIRTKAIVLRLQYFNSIVALKGQGAEGLQTHATQEKPVNIGNVS